MSKELLKIYARDFAYRKKRIFQIIFSPKKYKMSWKRSEMNPYKILIGLGWSSSQEWTMQIDDIQGYYKSIIEDNVK